VRCTKGEQPNQDSTRYVGGGKRPWVKYFNLKGEEFCIGTHGLSRLLKEFNTPFYVYDAGIIRKKFLETKKTFTGFDLFYSLKANPNLSICALFRSIGANAEVASMGELYFALKAGFKPQQILFVGPGKTDEELEYAINSNIYAIVIESSNELRRAEKLGRRLNKEINALIRINTHERAKSTVGETMAGGPSKLGTDQEKVIESFKEINLASVHIIGIHIYTASQVLNVESLREAAQRTLDLAVYCSENLGFPLKCIDFGGGFGVPYSEDERVLNVEYLAAKMRDMIKERSLNDRNIRFILELGRYLVAESGVYITRVIDIKESRGKKFLVSDGGINHQSRPALMNVEHPIWILNKLSQRKKERVEITGPLCTAQDVLARDVLVPEPEIGDIIGIFNSGAYGFSYGILNFLSHPWCPEVLIAGNRAFIIRKKKDVMELVEDQPLIEV